MRPPRAVLVDLNGTLFDDRDLPRAVASACADVAAALDLDTGSLVRANAAAWARLWPAAETAWTLGRIDGATLRLQVWRQTLSDCGCADESAATLAAATHASHTRRALRLYDDVLDFIDAVRSHCALGVVSNGASDDQRERLAWFDLARWFAPIVISAEHALAKPDAAIFRVALARLDVPPEDVWHVGDSLCSDVTGARGASITAVWLNRTSAARPTDAPAPDLEVSTLAQLAPLITGTADQPGT
jgi:HAD superfamily hydrolase (TIGR01549 family)